MVRVSSREVRVPSAMVAKTESRRCAAEKHFRQRIDQSLQKLRARSKQQEGQHAGSGDVGDDGRGERGRVSYILTAWQTILIIWAFILRENCMVWKILKRGMKGSDLHFNRLPLPLLRIDYSRVGENTRRPVRMLSHSYPQEMVLAWTSGLERKP